MAEPIVESSTEAVLNVAKTEAIKVLHVDDDHAFLKVAKQCLATQGEFEVDTASSVNEALKKLKKTQYDVVVSDYQMSGKDGLEFLKELREKGNTVPFIVFTGKGREEVVIKALNLGANQYLNKVGETETVYTELAHSIKELARIRKAEEATRRSEEKFRSLVEETAVPIAISDLKGRITYANEALAKLLGYSKQELMGHQFKDFLHPKDRGRVIRLFLAAVMLKSEPYNFEFRALHKDGHVLHLMSRPTRFIINGKTIGFQAVMMDMTGRKKAEEALRASEEKHRVISGITADFLFSCVKVDEEGLLIDWMAGATDKIFGYSAKEIQDKGCWKFTVQPQDLPTFEEKVTGLKPGQSSVCELRITHKDGSTRWIKVSSQVVKDSSSPANHRLFGACEDITERKKMDEEIKSLARFASENPNPVLRISQDSRILFANDAGKALLKKLNCEVGGSVPTFLKNLTVETLKSKSRRSEESEIEGRNYGFYATPIIDRGYVNVYVIDITERRKAQDILKESEAKYRTLVEQSSQGIVIAQGVPPRLVFANPAMVRISGYTSEELASVPMERLIHPDDRAVFFSRLKQRFEGKPTSSPNEYRAIRKDGKTAWIAISASRIEYDGQPAVQAVFVDITESKKTEQAIIENKQKFESLFKGNPEAAAYLGPDFCILDVNPRFEKLFGYSLAEVKGKNIDDVVVQGDKMEEAELLNEKAIQGYVYHNTLRRRKDGSLVPVSVSAAPIAVEGGLAGIVAMYKDISELKDAEKRLKMMNEKLRVVGGFTRHDVRNKLATVTGNVFLTKKSLTGNPEVLERLGEIEVACRQIVQIFDFATAYEKLGVEEHSYVDVTKTLEEALSLFQDLQNVEVTSNCHGLAVLADSLLRQLFYNLIDNSLKHGEKVGQIRIHYETTEDGLRLIYEDDGMGIATAEKPKLFKEGHGKGTGYGLYLIKKITEVYGWSIEETGEAGKGARFVIIMRRGTQDGRESYRIDPNQQKNAA